MEIKNTIMHNNEEFKIGDYVRVLIKYPTRAKDVFLGQTVHEGRISKINNDSITIDNSKECESNIVEIGLCEIGTIAKVKNKNDLIKINHRYYDGFSETCGMQYIKSSKEINIDVNMKDMKITIDDLFFALPKLPDKGLLNLRENNKPNIEENKYGVKDVDIVLVKGDNILSIKTDDVRVETNGYFSTIKFKSPLFDKDFDKFLNPDSIEINKQCKSYVKNENFIMVDTYKCDPNNTRCKSVMQSNMECYENKISFDYLVKVD